MRIVALLAVRNEERYLKRCLHHLNREGIEVCLIDNGSTDLTLEIAESFRDKNVIRIERLPFEGSFALRPVLETKERLAGEIKADWFIHHDADEIRQAPPHYKSLKEAITDVDRQGYNSINFDEFVFLPTAENPNHEGKDYVESMRHYYFFELRPLRRINAWKKFGQMVDLVSSGGHEISFEGQKIFPQTFIMRHYIALSYAHASAKFCGRVFLEKEVVEDNWHGYRAKCHPNDLVLPKASELKEIKDAFSPELDKSDVWRKHFFVKQPTISRVEKVKAKLFTLTENFTPGSRGKSLTKKTSTVNEPPIPFFVGVNGSGNAVFGEMFNAHPEMAIVPKTQLVFDLVSQSGNNQISSRQFFKKLNKHPQWPNFNISRDVFKQRLDAINQFSSTDGLRIFYQLFAENSNKKRCGDETPSHDHHMLDIATMLPEARFIHIVRDGRDVAVSQQKKVPGIEKDIETLANYWIWRIRDTRRQGQQVPHYIEVRFEDLVEDTVKTIKKICDFVELPFSQQMLEPGHKASNKEMIGAWRSEMLPGERSKFEAIAGDLLRDLGYL